MPPHRTEPHFGKAANGTGRDFFTPGRGRFLIGRAPKSSKIGIITGTILPAGVAALTPLQAYAAVDQLASPPLLAGFALGAGAGVLILGAVLAWRRVNKPFRKPKGNDGLSPTATRDGAHVKTLIDTIPSGVFELDADNRLTYANHRWFEIHGSTADQLIGQHLHPVVHPEDRDWVCKEWGEASGEGRAFHREHRILRPDGKMVWLLTHAVPRVDKRKTVIGHIGSVIDISKRKEMEIALRQREREFRQLYREAPLPYQSLALPDGKIVEVNDAWLDMTGYGREEVIGHWIGDFMTEESSARLPSIFQEFIAEGTTVGHHFRFCRKNGEIRIVEVSGRIGYDEQGNPAKTHSILTDVTERTRMENSLRLLTMAVEQSPLAVMITNVDTIIEYVNPAFSAISGYSLEEAVGRTPRLIKGGETSQEEYRAMWRHLVSGDSWHGIFHNKRKDGSFYWEDAVIAPVRDTDGVITHYIGLKQDITARREAEDRVAFLAHHDALTKLPNRLLGKDRMEWAMAHADRAGCKAALAFLDLDNFKGINDSLGHAFGDILLRSVAERLRDCVRETDTISRQGGDEFLIVLSEIDDPEAIAQIAAKILNRLQTPFLVGGIEISTSLSIGIAVYPDDGDDFDALLKRADTAMYHAKEAGRNTYRFFAEQMNIDASEYLAIRNSLHRALERDEFALYYQPQISLSDGAVTGFEALIRWNHPELGLIGPARFIPVAEESGIIVQIGNWVLEAACRQAMTWQAEGYDITVAVNLSGVQFRRGDILDDVKRALSLSGLAPDRLELEITESTLVEDSMNIRSILSELKALGVKLSIDDFGTGYSSLAYLKRFQVDRVKIDQSFVRDITSDPNDAAIVRAVVQMARSLGLQTVAEGVENSLTLTAVRDHGCDAVQGYHFAKPMPQENVAGFFRNFADHGADRGHSI